MGWLDSVEHSRWLSKQMQALLEHGHAAMAPTGFGNFTADGQLDTSVPVDLAVTARMTYVYSLGTLMGIPGSRRYCDHGIRCLTKYFKDPEFGGWYTAIEHEPSAKGQGVPWGEEGARKWQYAHSFLILAASAAAVANRAGAYELLREALENQRERWINPDTLLVRDSFSRDWKEARPYRGMNSLMHTIEAYLAAAEATTVTELIDQAERMLRFVYEQAKEFEWRVPEHYDQNWKPLPDYNRDEPNTPYYPYGFVIGHGMELSRLAVQVRAALRSIGHPEPDYLLEMSQELFERARLDGWRRGGIPGFIYSTDFQGSPVLRDHLQWVVSEGISASVALRRALLDDGASLGEVESYEHAYRAWLDYLNDYMLAEPGKLVRALDENNQPQDESISSRPDIFHSLQSLLMPRLPLWPPLPSALCRNLLDHPEQPAADKKSWSLFRR